MSYVEVKGLMYIAMTLMGIMLIFLAEQVPFEIDPAHVSATITAGIFLTVGLVLVLFGILTYLFREDPDIWR